MLATKLVLIAFIFLSVFGVFFHFLEGKSDVSFPSELELSFFQYIRATVATALKSHFLSSLSHDFFCGRGIQLHANMCSDLKRSVKANIGFSVQMTVGWCSLDTCWTVMVIRFFFFYILCERNICMCLVWKDTCITVLVVGGSSWLCIVSNAFSQYNVLYTTV